AAVERQCDVLDVNVRNAVGKAAEEFDRIDALPVEVTGIEREAELLTAAQRFQGHLGTEQVERNLARVYLEGELDAAISAHIQDRFPLAGKIVQACFDLPRTWGRIAGNSRPQRRASEATDDGDPQLLRRANGRRHF